MKKVEQISLAGYAFLIDLDAQELLFDYMQSLTAKYGSSDENELIQDIELRIAEIFSEKSQQFKEVINIEMVRSVIAQIGQVNLIEKESIYTESSTRNDFDENTYNTTKEKRQGAVIINIDKVKQGANTFVKVIGRVLVGFLMVILLGLIITVLISCTLKDTLDIDFENKLGLIYIPSMIIPFILFLMALSSRLYNRGKNFFSRSFTIIFLFIIFIVNLLVLISYTVKMSGVMDYEEEQVIVRYIDINENENLNIVINEENRYLYYKTRNKIIGRKKIYIKQDINIEGSDEIDQVKVVVKKTNVGSDKMNAIFNGVKIRGNTVYIDKYIEVDLLDVIRSVDIDVDIIYPESKVNVKKRFIE